MNFKKFDNLFNLTVLVIFLATPIALHEYTHGYLYQEAGCTNVEYGLLPDTDSKFVNSPFAVTTAHCNHLPQQELENLRMTQNTVEAVGYQTIPLYWIIAVMFILQNKRTSQIQETLHRQNKMLNQTHKQKTY